MSSSAGGICRSPHRGLNQPTSTSNWIYKPLMLKYEWRSNANKRHISARAQARASVWCVQLHPIALLGSDHMNKEVNTWLDAVAAQGTIITPLRSACFSPTRVPLPLMDCRTETREETITSFIFFLCSLLEVLLHCQLVGSQLKRAASSESGPPGTGEARHRCRQTGGDKDGSPSAETRLSSSLDAGQTWTE